MGTDWGVEIDKVACELVPGMDARMAQEQGGEWVHIDDVLALIGRAQREAWNAAIEAALMTVLGRYRDSDPAGGMLLDICYRIRALRKEGT